LEHTTFGSGSKVPKKVFLDLKTFHLVPKDVGTNFGTRSKVLIMVFLALKTFDLVPKVASSFLAQYQKL